MAFFSCTSIPAAVWQQRWEVHRCPSVHAIKNTCTLFICRLFPVSLFTSLRNRAMSEGQGAMSTGCYMPYYLPEEATVGFRDAEILYLRYLIVNKMKHAHVCVTLSATKTLRVAFTQSSVCSLWSVCWPSKWNIIVYCFTPPWTTFTSPNIPDTWNFSSVAKQQARPKYPSNRKQIRAVNEHAKESTSNGWHC